MHLNCNNTITNAIQVWHLSSITKNRKGFILQGKNTNRSTRNQADEFKLRLQLNACNLTFFFVEECPEQTVHEERILNSHLISIATWENWLNTTLALMWVKRFYIRQRKTELAHPHPAVPSISSVLDKEYIKQLSFSFFFFIGASHV